MRCGIYCQYAPIATVLFIENTLQLRTYRLLEMKS